MAQVGRAQWFAFLGLEQRPDELSERSPE